jgi:hypothetical protein
MVGGAIPESGVPATMFVCSGSDHLFMLRSASGVQSGELTDISGDNRVGGEALVSVSASVVHAISRGRFSNQPRS